LTVYIRVHVYIVAWDSIGHADGGHVRTLLKHHASVLVCNLDLPHAAAAAAAAAAAYVCRCLCIYSGQLRDEVMQDARILALQALVADSATATAAAAAAVPSLPLKLQAAAMSRLASVLDGASGMDFLAFVGAARRQRDTNSSGSSSSSSGLVAVVRLLLQRFQGLGYASTWRKAGGVRLAILNDARQVSSGRRSNRREAQQADRLLAEAASNG
jgi:hypothetical protein